MQLLRNADVSSSAAVDRELRAIGKEVFESTKYKLLSSRTIYPDKFEYPSQSVQGKKELLLSLSPMLLEAEAERKRETAECEQFTRCRVGKGKGRYSCYEYTDIDVGDVVDLAEYTNRYLKFIYRNRPQVPEPAATVVHPSVLEPTRQSDSRNSTESISIMDSPDFPEKNNSSRRGQARRGTLSPATARAMMLEAMDEAPVISSLSLSPVDTTKTRPQAQARRATLSPATARAMLLENAAEDELNCSVESTCSCSSASSSVKDETIQNEPHDHQIPEPIKVSIIPASTDDVDKLEDSFDRLLASEAALPKRDQTSLSSELSKTVDTTSAPVNLEAQNVALKLLDSHLLSFQSSVETSKCIEIPNSKSSVASVDDIDVVSQKYSNVENTIFANRATKGPMKDEAVANAAAELAECRLHLRYEQLLWKYHWEVVSIHAAQVACKKYQQTDDI